MKIFQQWLSKSIDLSKLSFIHKQDLFVLGLHKFKN